jgi:hypothetical protein
MLIASCKFSIVDEAIRAESYGRVINNQIMSDLYSRIRTH